MSKYYNIKGLKVRVSDHEPNFSLDKMRGSNNIELYIKGVCNELLSVESQLEHICEKRDLNLEDFQQVINDWKDGSYNVDFFKSKVVEEDIFIPANRIEAIRALTGTPKEIEDYIRNYKFSVSYGKELYKEIKQLSETTGVSQSKIKQIKGIR